MMELLLSAEYLQQRIGFILIRREPLQPFDVMQHQASIQIKKEKKKTRKSRRKKKSENMKRSSCSHV
jgi:hypothetical protein